MTKRKYRKFSPEFKTQIVLDIIGGNKSQAQVSREYDIHPQLIQGWKEEFLSRASDIFKDKREDKDKEKQKIKELENIIGRQTIELQFLKKTLKYLD